jgi:hypothetical protein
MIGGGGAITTARGGTEFGRTMDAADARPFDR